MPDEKGNIKGAFFRAESWLKVFGPKTPPSTSSNCQGPEGDCGCNVTIEWTPDGILDGAFFVQECNCEDRCCDPNAGDCKNPKQ